MIIYQGLRGIRQDKTINNLKFLILKVHNLECIYILIYDNVYLNYTSTVENILKNIIVNNNLSYNYK